MVAVATIEAAETRPAVRVPGRRALTLAVVWILVLGNAAAIVYLWVQGGNLDHGDAASVFTSIARITGLLCAYLALIQVLLLARVPQLERAVGFDRLTIWHRWNGHATVDLLILHVIFSVWGYALMDKFTIGTEISTMLGGGVYPGMITATIGTAMLIAVVATSLVIARRRLRYEWWYAVHLLAYAGIVLGWFHQIPTGNELVLDTVAADYWRALYVATIAILVVFRLGVPFVQALSYRLRITDVVEEGPGVVSLRIEGRNLERLKVAPGQFFLWRFLTWDRVWSCHPFSLSQAPDGRSLRITVKALGDHSEKLAKLRVGTRVVAEGPMGVFHRGCAPPRADPADRRRDRHHSDPRADGRGARRCDRPLPRHPRGRGDLPRRARHDRPAPRDHAPLRRRRPRGARGRAPARAGASARTRAGHRRPRRLSLRAARHDGRGAAAPACSRRSPPSRARRTLRPLGKEPPTMYATAATPAVAVATSKKKVTTKTTTVSGDAGSAGRWGDVQVTLTVRKTTAVVGKKKTVMRKVTAVNVPVYPNHTDRSVFISENALPMLVQEELTAQFDVNGIQLISRATDTSQAFVQSLQSALLKAKAL